MAKPHLSNNLFLNFRRETHSSLSLGATRRGLLKGDALQQDPHPLTLTLPITKQAMLRRLRRYPVALKQSITYNNGSENTLHEEINAALGTRSYFCAPYHSWEKGSVEQVNGLVCRFFPKGTNFATLGQAAITRVEKLLNHRPRKCLHYRTPYEVFREARGALSG